MYMYTDRNNHLFWTDVFNDSVFIWRSHLGDGSEAMPIVDTGASPSQYGRHTSYYYKINDTFNLNCS